MARALLTMGADGGGWTELEVEASATGGLPLQQEDGMEGSSPSASSFELDS